MEQLTELKNAIIERFKLSAYIKKLEDTIRDHAQEFTLKKYKGTIILRGGLQYELFAVRVHNDTWSNEIKPKDVTLILTYTIISKINSNQKKTLLKAKDNFNSNNGMGWYQGRKKLWTQESYTIKPESVMKDQINLEIENTI